MLLAAPAFAEEVNIALDGDAEISTTAESPFSAADAQSAVSARLDAVKACFADGTDAVDVRYKVALDVDGTGAVTSVRAVEGAPEGDKATCIDAALKGATLPALSKPEALVTVTVTVKATRAATEPKQPTEVTPVQTEVPAVDKTVSGTDVSAQPAETQGTAPSASEVRPVEKVTQPAGPSVTETESKPWKVTAQLTQSIGQGTFIGNGNYSLYAYALSLGASYRLVPKYLSLAARLPMDQELTCSYATAAGDRCARFFVRDLGISASAPELYKDEEFTGIQVTGSFGLSFPISEASREAEIALGARLNVGLSRAFENVGPGTLSLSWSGGVRHNFGPATRTWDANDRPTKVASSRSVNRNDKGEVFTNSALSRWSLFNGVNVSYDFLEKFTASVDFQMANVLASRLYDSETGGRVLTAGVVFDPSSRSPNATDEIPQSDLMTTSIELAYSVLDNLSVALGVSTATSPFHQKGSNSSTFSNPFWDNNTGEFSGTTFYLDLAANY